MFQFRLFDNFLSPGGWDLPVLLAGAFTSVTIILLLTRLTSGNQPSSSSGSKPPPSLPYWIPFLGHLPQCLYDINAFLNESKAAFSGTGIFALFLGSARRNIVYSPSLIKKLFHDHLTQFSSIESERKISRHVYDVPKNQVELYHRVLPELQEVAKPHLEISTMDQKKLEDIMRHLQGNLPDLVTFNPSMVDQEPWERVSAVFLAEDRDSAEVSLLPLVFIFLTHMTTDTLLTDSILSDSDHHEIAPLLLAFIQSYSLLETGIPRFIPHPTLPGAYITRQRLFKHLDAILDVVEDEDMQGPLLAERQRVFTEHDAPANIRTSDLLRFLYQLNMPHVLTFWALLHIISDKILLERIRKETGKFINVIQDAPVMGFSVPPRTSIDAVGLMAGNCPLLESCLLETSRLYSRKRHSLTATRDFDLEGDAGGVFKTKDIWRMQKGELIDIPYWLANNDGANWDEPETWDSERYLTNTEADAEEAKYEVINGYGAFESKSKSDTSKLFSLSFIASVLALWDFEVGAEKAAIPKPQFAAGVALPTGDFRVRIQRRVKS